MSNFYVVSTLDLGWILVLTCATKILFLYNVMILISIRRLVDVDVWFCGRWVLVDWTLDFGSVDVRLWLFGRWILVVLILVLVVWTLDRRQNVTFKLTPLIT